MKTKLIILLLISLLNSCTHEIKQQTHPESSALLFLNSYNEIAGIAGLKPLSQKKLKTNEKEIRLWLSFSTSYIHEFFVINVSTEKIITGNRYIRYKLTPESRADFEDYSDEDNCEEMQWCIPFDTYFENIYPDCENLIEQNWIYVCEHPLPSGKDWKTIYEQLEKNNVWTAKDGAEIENKDDLYYLDGYSVIVELREKDFYRAFNRGLNSGDEGYFVNKVFSILYGD